MSQEINEEYDVIIVGAGVSGLVAALTIIEKDPRLKLLIIEKSGRCKGNDSDEDIKKAFGYVSESNYFLKDLFRKLNLPILKRRLNGKTLGEFIPGQVLTSNEEIPLFGNSISRLGLLLFLSKLEKISKRVTLLQPMGVLDSSKLDKVNLEDFVKCNLSGEFSRNFIINIAESVCGVSARKISALFYIALCNSTLGITNQFSLGLNGLNRYLLKGGKKIICDTILLHRLGLEAVNYNEKVIKINRNNHTHVLIETNKIIYSCLYTIIAIPPRDVLDIEMNPKLPESRLTRLKNVTYGNLNSLLVTYSADCWSKKNLSGDILCGVKNDDNVLIKCTNITRIYPCTFHLIASQNQHRNIFFKLNSFFKSDELPERFSKPALIRTCIPLIGELRRFDEIRRPLNRIFWAGSHTATVWYGQLEGSVQSGTKAAIELLYDFKPQILTVKDIIRITRRGQVMDKFSEDFMVKLFENKILYSITLTVSSIVLWLVCLKLKKMLVK